ncbi:hypothetical protein BGS_0033 [Beggiatoa sp. SS]|nr:hypothetical protein BGS_0033 [Beggiatoa sp. SS]
MLAVPTGPMTRFISFTQAYQYGAFTQIGLINVVIIIEIIRAGFGIVHLALTTYQFLKNSTTNYGDKLINH